MKCQTVIVLIAILTASIKPFCHDFLRPVKMLRQLTLGLAVLSTGFIPGAFTTGWNYDGSDGDLGPNDWIYNYSMCAGTSQSPINIVTSILTSTTGNLTFSGYDTAPTNQYTLLNNGHTIQINVNVKTSSIKNSRLDGTYVLEQFHFHWDVADNNGSEHSVDGVFHPLEIHFVHYNSDKYDNISQAAGTNDSSALLVLGVFVDEASTDTSSTLMSLVDSFTQVWYKSNRTDISSFSLNGLLPSLSSCQPSTIYSYSGSLTTPPCSQVVNWNVFAQPIYISSTQMNKFRNIYGENPLKELTRNDRPVQPINGRTIYSYTIRAPDTCTANSTQSNDAATNVTIVTTATTANNIGVPGKNNAESVNCSQLITLLGLAAYMGAILVSLQTK